VWIGTQALLARVPQVAISAVDKSGVDGADPGALLGQSSVTPRPNSDLLTIAVRDPDAARATKLTAAYAQAFVQYRRDLDRATLQSVIDDVEGEIDAITPPANDNESTLLVALTDTLSRLRGVQALQTANVTVVRPAAVGGRIENEPKQAAAAGAALGLVVGLALALLLEALARKVRTEDEVSDRLGLPVLGRVPAPSRQRRPKPGLAMRDRLDSPEAEVYRGIRAAIELAAAPDMRTIMVSAVDGEVTDTPTVAANLAIALARSSIVTILIDLDLRHGALDDLFATNGRPGLTEVVSGAANLDDVLVTAWAGDPVPVAASADASDVDNRALLQYLPSGARTASVGDLVASPRLGQVLEAAEERAVVVVLHGPALVGTADVLTLSDSVDGLVVVAGLDQARRRVLEDVREALAGVVETLGVIVTSPKSVSAASLRRGRPLLRGPAARGTRASRPREDGATPLDPAARQIRP
jgi:Mrp family chromosome partitioning ATPase